MRAAVILTVAMVVVGCGKSNTGQTNNAATSNNTTANNTTSNNTTSNNTTSNNTTANNTTANNTTANNTTTMTTSTTGSTNSAVMIPCENLDYMLSCNAPQSANGYPACSDYFGDVTGVEVSCSVNPQVEVGTTPCAEYEFYVGSCVYYNPGLPDRCYITHVGAESADLVEAGKMFWAGACANWMPAP